MFVQFFSLSSFRKRLTTLQEKQAALLSSENMHVFLLGSGGPIPNETRDVTAFAVIAGGEFVMVDVGPGIVPRSRSDVGLDVAQLSRPADRW